MASDQTHDAGASDQPNDRREHAEDSGARQTSFGEVGGSGTNGSLPVTLLVILVVLAVIYTLYFASDFLLPIAVAILLNFLLKPFTRMLHNRLRCPDALAAVVIAVVFGGSLLAGGYGLSYPMLDWIEQAPQSLDRIQQKFSGAAGTGSVVDKVRNIFDRVENMTEMPAQDNQGDNNQNAGKNNGSASAESSEADTPTAPEPVPVRESGSNLSGLVMGYLSTIGKAALSAGVLTFFLLASGDTFLRKLVHVLPRVEEKKKAAVIAHRVEQNISTFLITYTAINICLGLATAGVMWLLGLPNPLLWGAVAGVFNYVPYLGPFGVMLILLVVGLLQFDTIGHAVAGPACFFGLNLLEAYAATPALLGKRLSLHPVAVLLSIIFWFFIWGVMGAIMAVPLLVAFKIICEHFEPLHPIGEFLSGATTQRPSEEAPGNRDPDKHPSPQPSLSSTAADET